MEKQKLINYTVGEKISEQYLRKQMGEDYQTAIKEGYFVYCETKDQEEVFIFTEKGKKFAWS